MTDQDWPTVEADLRATLVRYLPVGQEGVAAAQASGVAALLARHRAKGASRAAVPDQARQRLRQARETFLDHRPSRGAQTCPVCRARPNSPAAAAWPCPVWDAGIALGVVSVEDSP